MAAVVALLLALAVVVGACGIPTPFDDSGQAHPEAPNGPVPRPVVATPRMVAAAAVAAWQRNDAAALDRLSTQTAAQDLLKRPFPSPAPTLINCQTRAIPGTEACLFTNGALNFTLFVQRDQEAGGWAVARSRFLA
jgi:hypothetical protein